MLLTATLLATGGVELAVDGTRWLSSEVAAIRRGDDTWAATDCAFVNGTCAPLGAPAPRERAGRDAVGGAYASEELAYEVDGKTWTTGARAYAAAPDAVVLSQRFDGNWTWPGSGAADDVASSFPTWTRSLVPLGALLYEGIQLQNTRFVRPEALWGARLSKKKKPADDDGAALPLVVVDGRGAAVVLSPVADFFTTCQTPFAPALPGTVACGAQATAATPPATGEHLTLAVAARSPSAALARWGALLRGARAPAKPAPPFDVARDALAYYTDNGAFYYYHTVAGACAASCLEDKALAAAPYDGSGYRATVESAWRAASAAVPVQSMQYDSWFYRKDPKDSAALLWEPMPSTLGARTEDDDSTDAWLKLPAPTVLHARYLSAENWYKTGAAPALPRDAEDWSWLDCGDDEGAVAVSDDVRFYDHIFRRAKDGLGMAAYEQDFLAKQYERCAALRRDPGAADRWLAAMAAAARRANVTVQYCMALPRHVLAAALDHGDVVTHARGSHDYGQSRPDDTEQWSALGATSLLLWAASGNRVAPHKDALWSSGDTEPGNAWGDATREADPELQLVVAALTGGPVAVGDDPARVNKTRVSRACRADGVLLKPARPAFLVDGVWPRALAGPRDDALGVDDVWEAPLLAGGRVVLAANLSSPFRLTVADLAAACGAVECDGGASQTYAAREFYSGELRVVDGAAPLRLGPTARPARCAGAFAPGYCVGFELWTLAPFAGGLAFLGDVDKVVALAPQRFAALDVRADAVSARVLHGAPDEAVRLGVAFRGGDDDAPTLLRVDCPGGAAASALSCAGGACSCAALM